MVDSSRTKSTALNGISLITWEIKHFVICLLVISIFSSVICYFFAHVLLGHLLSPLIYRFLHILIIHHLLSMFYTSLSVVFFFKLCSWNFPTTRVVSNIGASKLFFSAIGSFLQSRGTPNNRQATAKLLWLRMNQPLKVPPTPPPGFWGTPQSF